MDDIDRILASDGAVAPSARFAADVMDTIAVVAAEPPPLPFPWGRFAAGVLACTACAASGVWLIDGVGPSVLSDVLTPLAHVKNELESASAAIVISLVALRVQKVRSD